MLGDTRFRLALLLSVLAALVAYALMTWTGAIGGGGRLPSVVNPDCPIFGAPTVDSASREDLRRLREGLRRPVASLDLSLRPYEEGPILASSAWSDAEPGDGGPLPRSAPAGYEMRWWMPSGDDVVADAMAFAKASEARAFLERASSVDCRSDATAAAAALPPGGRNLEWRNPDRVIEQDVYLRHGSRVYRVAVVRPDSTHRPAPPARGLAFKLVDALACLLPDAGCRLPGTRGEALSLTA